MSVVGSFRNTCTALVAVQAIDVSKKVFSHRQNKLVKIKLGLQHLIFFFLEGAVPQSLCLLQMIQGAV